MKIKMTDIIDFLKNNSNATFTDAVTFYEEEEKKVSGGLREYIESNKYVHHVSSIDEILKEWGDNLKEFKKVAENKVEDYSDCYKIYLDKIRTPTNIKPNLHIKKDYNSFVKLVKAVNELIDGKPVVIFFGNLDKDEAFKCAQYIIQNNVKIKMFWVDADDENTNKEILSLLNHWFEFNKMEVRGIQVVK